MKNPFEDFEKQLIDIRENEHSDEIAVRELTDVLSEIQSSEVIGASRKRLMAETYAARGIRYLALANPEDVDEKFEKARSDLEASFGYDDLGDARIKYFAGFLNLRNANYELAFAELSEARRSREYYGIATHYLALTYYERANTLWKDMAMNREFSEFEVIQVFSDLKQSYYISQNDIDVEQEVAEELCRVLVQAKSYISKHKKVQQKILEILKMYGLDSVDSSIPIDLLDYLVQLIEIVEKIKRHQRIDSTELVNQMYYQFTRIETLAAITGVNDVSGRRDFRLRLYNSDYMNDSSEGRSVLTSLKDSKFLKELIGDVQQLFPGGDDDGLHSSHVFLASLSGTCPKGDSSMPMWNTYADFHQGVALGIKLDVESFAQDSERVEKSIIDSGLDYLTGKNNGIGIGVYRVVYVNKDGIVDESTDGFAKHDLEDLSNVLENIGNASKLVLQDIKTALISFLRQQLNQVRFLYKKNLYEYENEIRIVVEDTGRTTQHDLGNPKLFIEVPSSEDAQVSVNLEEVIFGSNAGELTNWKPIIHRNLGPVKVTRSIISYHL
jgi:hypothetical protein